LPVWNARCFASGILEFQISQALPCLSLLSLMGNYDIEQIDTSFSFVCPVVDHEFCHNIVKVAVDPQGDSRVDPQTTLTML